MAEHTEARLQWVAGTRMVAQAGSGHSLVTEAVGQPGHAGASPMELLLIGVAGCTAIDIVAILEKMRQPLAGLEVAVRGERAESHPKRFTSIEMTYLVRGRGLSREKVERAVELSRSTYCSALASLRPDCEVRTSIELIDAVEEPQPAGA